MSIVGYAQDENGTEAFGLKLKQAVSPAGPVSSIQHLKGREDELEQIARALFQTGRSIFVFGDRGVGKSSLAATAAVQYATSEAPPIRVSGSPDDNFASIIANIGAQALNRSRSDATKRTTGLSMEWRGMRWTSSEEVSALDLRAQIKTVGDAAELLKQIAVKRQPKPAVILDEFDAVPSLEERARFAALLKQLGDHGVEIKFFISGVADSMNRLLGANASAHRQLATIPLDRLPWMGRREIVDEALGAFGMNCDNDVNWRIAMISDGFPYYVHLMVEHMLWEAYDDEEQVQTLAWKHFYGGLRRAVKHAVAALREPYEKAVLQRPAEYEDVVWATADGDDLLRSLSAMRFSYDRVCDKHKSPTRLEPAKFNEVIRRLKLPSLGHILDQVEGRPGWYIYHEKMLRGFVRMQAEANGVELTGERPAPRQTIHIPNARTGYHGPSVPPGVNLRATREQQRADDASPEEGNDR